MGKSKICLVISLFFLSSLSADTIFVPTDYSTIQKAINAAVNGDEIIVKPGTYNEHIDFKGKSITVKSESGPSATMIKNESNHSVAFFSDNEDHQSILDGFTLTETLGSFGTGVWCNGSSPTIRNNIICDIRSYFYYGAGVHLDDSDAILDNNVIENNLSDNIYYEGYGGGVCCMGTGSPTITNNIIRGNRILTPSDADRRSCGGGLACIDETSPLIMNNLIEENVNYFEADFIGQEVRGGGVYLDGTGEIVMVNNVIRANRIEIDGVVPYADAYGGGVYCSCPNTLIMNCVFYENQAVALYPTGRTQGGGLYVGYSNTEIVNCILWGNEAKTSGDQIKIYYYSDPIVRNCCIQDGCPDCAAVITQDPRFRIMGNGLSDFILTPNSPCINRGANDVPYFADFEGNIRPHMGTIDIGIDEYTGLHPLSTREFTLSESMGGLVNLTLDAGNENAGRTYIILTGITVTNPGYSLPLDQAYIPINWDIMTDLGLSLIDTPYFSGFLGQMDAYGQAQAQMNTMGPIGSDALVGESLSFAYCLRWPWEFASNPINVMITP